MQIRRTVMTAVSHIKNIPLNEVKGSTAILPSTVPGEHPIADAGRSILTRLSCQGAVDTSTLRTVHSVEKFTLWAENELRQRGFSIVTPRVEEIREVVQRCIEGHYKLPNKRSSLDDLTIIDCRACTAIAEELVLTEHQLPKDKRMTLYDLLRWVGDAVVTRTHTPPPAQPDRRKHHRQRQHEAE